MDIGGVKPARSLGEVAGVGEQPSAESEISFNDALARLLPTAGASLVLSFAADAIGELQNAGEENSGVGGPGD